MFFMFEYLRHGNVDEIHGTMLIIYCAADLDETEIFSHFLSSELESLSSAFSSWLNQMENYMMRYNGKDCHIQRIHSRCWRRIYEHVLDLTLKVLVGKNISQGLRDKAYDTRGF